MLPQLLYRQERSVSPVSGPLHGGRQTWLNPGSESTPAPLTKEPKAGAHARVTYDVHRGLIHNNQKVGRA